MADNTVQLRALLASIAALPDALNLALNTRTAPNSLKLAGKTLDEIRAAIKTATDADIKVVSDLLAAFIARRDNPHAVTKAQVGLDLVENFAVATAEQGIAGTATNLYLTPAVLKASLDAFWTDMAGTAPETLDTINEIAAALNNDPDVVKNLTTLVGANKTALETLKTQVEGLSTTLDGRLDVLETASSDYATRVTALETNKLDKTAQAADSKLLEGKTLAEVLSQASSENTADLQALSQKLDTFIANKATSEDAVAGTDDSKYITAKSLKAATDAAIADLVDGAPTALDTLKELADLLTSEGDAIAALTTLVDGKLGKTEKAADSSLLDGQTLAQIIAGLRGEAQGSGLDLSAINVRSYYTDGGGSNNIIPMANVQSVSGIQASIASDGTFVWNLPASVAAQAALANRLWSFELNTGKAFGTKVRATLKKLVVAQPGGAAPVKTLGANEVNSGDLYFFDDNIQSNTNVQPNAGFDSLQLNVPQELTLTNSTHVALSRYGDSSTILELQVLLEVSDGQGGWEPLLSTGAGAPGDSSLTILGLRDLLAARIATAEGRLTALENGETAADGRLDALEPRVATAESDIDKLQADVVALKADDTAVDGRLDAAETRLTALESGETAADGRLDALEPRVTANETDIAALKTGKLDKTGQAADSKLLEGKTVAQITDAITGGSTETLKALRDALDAFIANKASAEEAVAGTNDSKYITAVGLKAATDSAIAALVDGAPTALDTLKELADKLIEEGDALAALVTQVDQKLDKTAQAADSKLLEGKTVAQVREGLATQNDLQLAVDKMTRSFEDAVDELDGVSRLRAQLTVATLDTDQFGFDDNKGALTPNTLFDSTIVSLEWDVSAKTVELAVNGDHTAEDVRTLIIDSLSSKDGTKVFANGVTVFTFTYEDLSTLPTTGTLPVAVRYA